MGPQELAVLCCEAADPEQRRHLLRLLRAGVDPRAGLPADGGRLRRCLDEALAPCGAMAERWSRLAEDIAGGRLHLLRPGAPDYPPALAVLARPPDPLFALGRLELARREALAIVGTRRPDGEALAWTRRIAGALAARGLVVVSGGAAGIDAAAHAAAGAARTIAVLGSGFRRPYPAWHRDLFADIAGEGLLLSEWPPWTRPDTWRFPRRNRVIAGLGRAVVVVQAPARSGALSTARHAVEEGREVLVCPGPAGHPLFAGCHRLIREGARLAATLEDIWEDLDGLPFAMPLPCGGAGAEDPPAAPGAAGPPPAAVDPDLWRLLAQPRGVDELATALGVPPAELAARLVEGELAGCLRALPGDRWERLG